MFFWQKMTALLRARSKYHQEGMISATTAVATPIPAGIRSCPHISGPPKLGRTGMAIVARTELADKNRKVDFITLILFSFGCCGSAEAEPEG